MTERVSVLICCYNYGRYLGQCLRSVLGQTRPPDEIIVVDDGSTDDTSELIKQFPEIKYFYQQNAGKPAAFGRAFSLSTGDVICHLDPDDYWEPRKLERVLAAFTENPQIGGVLHEVHYVNAQGNAIHFPWEGQHPDAPQLLTLEGSEAWSFLYPLPRTIRGFFGVPNTSSVRRAFVESLLPLPAKVGGSTDAIMVAAALPYGMMYLPEPLVACRIHGANADFGNVYATRETIGMWEFLLETPNFRRFLSKRHASVLGARILERKAFLSSRTGEDILAGVWAGIRIPFILAANGYLCNWKHLALPVACILPIRRERARPDMPANPAAAPPGTAFDALNRSGALKP
jgi:glycosyltransferase involved in cell wall biosynthesis